MKKKILFTFLTTCGLCAALQSNAQFGGLVQKAKDKAAQKAGEIMDKKTSGSSSSSESSSSTPRGNKLSINSGFDFNAGDSVLFAESFSNVADGAPTHIFKTNGAATVVSLKEVGGKWMKLTDDATYKLTKQMFLPRHFTVEFDVLAVADQIKDIEPLVFGFTKDNSVTDYNSGDGAYASLMYYNDNEIGVHSSYNDKYLRTEYDLNTWLNRAMHVSIMVEGDRMAVYLDRTKIADTQLFLPGSPRNFYISAPMHYKNGSSVLVSNFKIATFKKS